MIRIHVRYIGALIVLALPVLTAQAAELKIGYVNMERLFAQAPQAEAASKKLSQEFSAKQEKLASQQSEIKRQEEQLLREGDVLSPAQRRDQEQALQNMKREFRRTQEDFRDEVSMRRNEITAKFQEQVQHAVDAIGAEGGYDFILYEGVAYNSNKVDITEKVLERLRTTVGKPGAAEGKSDSKK